MRASINKINNFISNSVFEQSSQIMTTKNISKEFISSSDDLDISDDVNVTIGFGEFETAAKKYKVDPKSQARAKGSTSRPSDDQSSSAERAHKHR